MLTSLAVIFVITGTAYMYKAGVFAFIVSIIIAWLETCTLYGFGEIIDKQTEISENVKILQNQESALKDYLQQQNTKQSKTQNTILKDNEKTDVVKYEKVDEVQMENVQKFCPICKIKLEEGVEVCPKCGLDIKKRKELLS